MVRRRKRQGAQDMGKFAGKPGWIEISQGTMPSFLAALVPPPQLRVVDPQYIQQEPEDQPPPAA